MKMPVQKRLFDLALALTTVPIWLPVLLLCAIALALFEGFPIFYQSSRRVHGQRHAKVWKFRTMVRNAAQLYNRDTVPVRGRRFLNMPSDSPLYTHTGRLIEKCQFTELPQVVQVISGTLSLVGNRPLPENVVRSLKEEHPNTEARFDSVCGLTGLVQLIGRDNLDDAERLAIEIGYCQIATQYYSARLDFLILALTVLIHVGMVKPFTVADADRLLARFWRGPGGRTAELASQHARHGAQADRGSAS